MSKFNFKVTRKEELIGWYEITCDHLSLMYELKDYQGWENTVNEWLADIWDQEDLWEDQEDLWYEVYDANTMEKLEVLPQ